ncbi:hypothetical protein IAE_18732 [Escherichia coli XH140A]|nr:hypothetical protein IAE_18732 [Escherichia coli XH140A]EGV45835.1 hypothetical protein IAM_19909 [Escherichia coli XH001]
MNERGKEGAKRTVLLADGTKNSEAWIFVSLTIP